MTVIGVILVVLAVALLVLGGLAWSRKLPGNGVVGLRVAEVRKSRELWEDAHRVAGPLWVVSGIAMALSALVAFTATGWMWLIVVLAAVASLFFLGLGGSMGARAAAILGARAEAEEDASGEGGCCGGGEGGGCGCGSPAPAPEVDVEALRRAMGSAEK